MIEPLFQFVQNVQAVQAVWRVDRLPLVRDRRRPNISPAASQLQVAITAGYQILLPTSYVLILEFYDGRIQNFTR
jgi:hypothetical protein